MMRRGLVAFFGVAVLAFSAACGDDPVQVVFEVIEETEFAASLGVDLASMTRLPTGVYVKDIVVGTGDEAAFGTTPTLTYTGWLADGSEFDSGTFSFLMGNNRVVAGLEDGLVGGGVARVGGRRLMVIPPNRGYAGQDQVNASGQVVIPAGSILVFDITVDSVAQ